MKTMRNALLGTCLALPLLAATGHAQTLSRESGTTITVPPGAVVLIVPGPNAVTAVPTTAVGPNTATAMPQTAAMLRMIAQQQADMQRMFAQMNALFLPMPAMPNPSQLVGTAFEAGGPMLTMTAAPGVCSQSVTIVQHGDSAPVITRSESGCGSAPTGNATNVRDLPPATATPSHTPKLIQAHYAPQGAGPAHNLIAER